MIKSILKRIEKKQVYFLFLKKIKESCLNKKSVGLVLPKEDCLLIMFSIGEKCVFFRKELNVDLNFGLLTLDERSIISDDLFELIKASKNKGQLLSNNHVVEYFFEAIIGLKSKYGLNTQEIRMIFNLILQLNRDYFLLDTNPIVFDDKQSWVD